MSDNRISEQPGPGQDKLDAHCRQQLSALIDGELSPDEARFLLRRLGHDRELSACFDRWQLAGDMLRRVPCRAAPAGFADRIAAAVGAECAQADGRSAGRPSRRAAAWLRWSGGALAASVAAVALFVARQHLGGVEPEAPASDAPRVAATTMPAAAETVADAGDVAAPGVSTAAEAVAAASAPLVAAASSRQVADGLRRGSATRNQQAARRVVAVREEPRMVANAAASPGYTMPEATAASPFASPSALRAKPWPRSVLGTVTDHPFSASVQVGEGVGRAFYPFEPNLPAASESRAADHPVQR